MDSLLRTWRPLPYLVALRSLGIQISPGQVRWTTDCSRLPSLVDALPTFVRRAWFNAGSWLSSLLCLPCLLFLVYLLYQQLRPPQQEVHSDFDKDHLQTQSLPGGPDCPQTS